MKPEFACVPIRRSAAGADSRSAVRSSCVWLVLVTASAVGQESIIDVERVSGSRGRPTFFTWDFLAGPSEEPPRERFGKFKDDRILTDRPDFTESSTTVGRGVVQFETGYTYSRDRGDESSVDGHSFPEMLVRVGVVDSIELRLAYNFGVEQSRDGGERSTTAAPDDLYLGTKLWLTEQRGALPEASLVLQMTVPVGGPFSGDQVMPGANLLYGWDVTDFFSLAGSTQVNRSHGAGAAILGGPIGAPILVANEGVKEYFALFAQAMTIGYTLTERLGAYTEWFAFFPVGADNPETRTEHYFNGGFTYLITRNVQLDIRAGVGLNEAADDMFSGIGLSFRF